MSISNEHELRDAYGQGYRDGLRDADAEPSLAKEKSIAYFARLLLWAEILPLVEVVRNGMPPLHTALRKEYEAAITRLEAMDSEIREGRWKSKR